MTQLVQRLVVTLCMHNRGKAMPSCQGVCVCVCVGKKILKNYLYISRGAKAFTDVIVNENNQHNQIRTFLYLIQVQTVLYAVISATSYYRFCGSTPFESHVVLARDLVMVSNSNTQKYRHKRSRSGNDEEACRVSIPLRASFWPTLVHPPLCTVPCP